LNNEGSTFVTRPALQTVFWTFLGVLLLAPQVASAHFEASLLWWGRSTGQCQELSTADYGLATDRAPCRVSSNDADAENLCFESPSALPVTLARWQAEIVTAKLMLTVSRLHSQMRPESTAERSFEPWTFELPQTPFVSALEAMPRAPEPILACYAHPDQCRSLPPLPVSLNLASLAPVFNPGQTSFAIPPQSVTFLTQVAPWGRLRVGPSTEHRQVLEQPPRA
jgi:hypothetical protein